MPAISIIPPVYNTEAYLLAFIDADDFVKPQWLEKLRRSAVDTETGIVFTL